MRSSSTYCNHNISKTPRTPEKFSIMSTNSLQKKSVDHNRLSTGRSDSKKLTMRHFFSINTVTRSSDFQGEQQVLSMPLMQNAYASQSTPHMFILSPDGKVVKKDSVTHKISKSKQK